MNAVWKYEITVDDYISLQLPKGAKLLSVQVQYTKPCLWCLVNRNETIYETRTFLLVGTGYPITENNLEYIGTFQLYEGSYIGHLFEVIS